MSAVSATCRNLLVDGLHVDARVTATRRNTGAPQSGFVMQRREVCYGDPTCPTPNGLRRVPAEQPGFQMVPVSLVAQKSLHSAPYV